MKHHRTAWIAALGIALALLAGSPGGPILAQNEPPAVDWEKTFGGAGFDYAFAVRQTADGGIILAGQTNSSGAGQYDAYLIHTDGSGNLLWEKTYGGPYDDSANAVHADAGGGVAFAGRFSSLVEGSLITDVYLVKTDSLGAVVWERTFGGAGIDTAAALAATADGGFVIAGETASSGAGKKDVYLIRVDAQGGAVWERAFGGAEDDSASALQLAADGGLLAAGQTASKGAGREDVYLLKTDAQGNLLWEKTFGGAGIDRASALRETSTGGIIIAGHTGSSGAGGDVYLIRADGAGNLLWEKAFGGPNLELSSSVIETADEGFIFDSVDVINGGVDLIRTDRAGRMLWRRSLRPFSVPYALQAIEDNRLIAAGLRSRDVFLLATAPDPVLIDSTPPSIAIDSRSCAGEAIVLEIPCAGPDGAAVDFTVAVSDDRDPNPTWSCDRQPGSVFPIGTTAVACEAADASGNRARCDFSVRVADRLPPEIECPGDVTIECTGPDGAAVDFAVSARDHCDPAPSVSLSAPAGSVFAPGTHTVTATAADRSGNSASCEFRVRVTCSSQLPGDCNQDRILDISDAICAFGVLFLGNPERFPCGDGSTMHPANLALLDWQPDGDIDLSDPIGMLLYLFAGDAPHPLGVPGRESEACIPIPGCPVRPGC